MSSTRTLLQSFIGGEVSPEMLTRVRDPRVQEGAASLVNMQVAPSGVAYKRPGRRFINAARGPAGSRPRRGISYRVSSTQTIGVEMGDGYFRFHTTTGPQLYCKGRQVVSVNPAFAETLSFAQPHLLLTDDRVRVVETTGAGSVPGGVDEFVSYFTRVVDTHTIQLSLTAGGPAIDLTTAGSGTILVLDSADTPAIYSNPQNVSSITLATEVINFAADHNFSTGDRLFLNSATVVSVPILTIGGSYFARFITSTSITLHPTAADALAATNTITFSSFTAMQLRKFYEPGSLVFWPGAGKGFFYCHASPNTDSIPVSAPPSAANRWYRLPDTCEYEIPTPYVIADLPQITYDQDLDLLTLVHRNYSPRNLKLSGTTWTLTPITFASTLSAPSSAFANVNSRGEGSQIRRIVAAPAAVGVFVTGDPTALIDVEHAFGDNESVFILDLGGASTLGGSPGVPLPGFYRVRRIDAFSFELQSVSTGSKMSVTTTNVPGNTIAFPVPLGSDITNTYKITAIDADGRESSPSAETTPVVNNLFADGASNTVSWTAVNGAARYRVYKKSNGIFGLIGDVEHPTTTFTDDNIEAKFTVTLPIQDTSLSGSDNPGAVTHFEQRGGFGGTKAFPRDLWLTATGTVSDLSFHLPILDTDRIHLPMAISQRCDIRHLVAFGHLLILTDAAELRVTPLNSDALTPASVAVRPQSFVGSTFVRPQVANSTLVFAGVKGGHIYEMGFRQEAGGFITSDLCFRSAHLFDNFAVLDSARTTSPQPLLWFVSSTGKLLGLTYVPEEQIGAWHQHTTDGSVESCTSVSDGSDERLLVFTARSVNGTLVRHIECTTQERTTGVNAFYVDAGLTYDGHVTGYENRTGGSPITISLTEGLSWATGDIVKLTTGVPMFRYATDVGTKLRVTAENGSVVSMTVLEIIDSTHARVTLDQTLPVDLRDGTTAQWTVARRTFTGLDHLEGRTVRGLADGVPFTTTVLGGSITLNSFAAIVHVGLGYTAELRTVPLIAQTEGAGQGITKNVNQVWVRTLDSVSFSLGFTGSNVVPVLPEHVVDGVVRVMPNGNWNELGQITIRQDDPLPLTVLGTTLEVAIGG